jgi:hypothetical protein
MVVNKIDRLLVQNTEIDVKELIKRMFKAIQQIADTVDAVIVELEKKQNA